MGRRGGVRWKDGDGNWRGGRRCKTRMVGTRGAPTRGDHVLALFGVGGLAALAAGIFGSSSNNSSFSAIGLMLHMIGILTVQGLGVVCTSAIRLTLSVLS
eukprot:4176899-Pyramimonas_sp.AAC.1